MEIYPQYHNFFFSNGPNIYTVPHCFDMYKRVVFLSSGPINGFSWWRNARNQNIQQQHAVVIIIVWMMPKKKIGRGFRSNFEKRSKTTFIRSPGNQKRATDTNNRPKYRKNDNWNCVRHHDCRNIIKNSLKILLRFKTKSKKLRRQQHMSFS